MYILCSMFFVLFDIEFNQNFRAESITFLNNEKPLVLIMQYKLNNFKKGKVSVDIKHDKKEVTAECGMKTCLHNPCIQCRTTSRSSD